jgi:epoxyqueuosine reductase
MNKTHELVLRDRILAQTIALGATQAGIARVNDMQMSPSYTRYMESPYYPNFDGIPDWPKSARAILVFGLAHPVNMPEMDWWDSKPGGTPGNRVLMRIQRDLRVWLETELKIEAISLAYKIESGGIFLKDAAVLAGLGIVGRNNLLITPEHGARIRLRAMFLDRVLAPTGPIDFDPCTTCDKRCFHACPQDAFGDGIYQRRYCQVQMREDEANASPLPHDPNTDYVRYCRACELACPVGRNQV